MEEAGNKKIVDMTLTGLLAMERTKLANWRTFLAYIRTGISFVALALALIHFFHSLTWHIFGGISLVLGAAFLIAGFISYRNFVKKIAAIKRNYLDHLP
jgi:putative membrane protein